MDEEQHRQLHPVPLFLALGGVFGVVEGCPSGDSDPVVMTSGVVLSCGACTANLTRCG